MALLFENPVDFASTEPVPSTEENTIFHPLQGSQAMWSEPTSYNEACIIWRAAIEKRKRILNELDLEVRNARIIRDRFER